MGQSIKIPKVLQSDLDRYIQDGVVHLKGVLTPGQVESLRKGVALQIRNMASSQSAYDFEDMQKQTFSGEGLDVDVGKAERFDIELLKFIVETDPDARPLRDSLSSVLEHDNGEREESQLGERRSFFHDAAGWKHYDEIKSVALTSALPEIATLLMDTEYTHFWEDTTFVKAPQTPQRTVFHLSLIHISEPTRPY